jgi:hypothetical protein
MPKTCRSGFGTLVQTIMIGESCGPPLVKSHLQFYAKSWQLSRGCRDPRFKHTEMADPCYVVPTLDSGHVPWLGGRALGDVCAELLEETTVVICQLFDNSFFYVAREEGKRLLYPKWVQTDGIHFQGDLSIVNKTAFRELVHRGTDLKAANSKMIIQLILLAQ